MAEGFIIRRDGESKPMKVISSTFTGISTKTVTIQELIGCKCFYICAQGRAASNNSKVQSISYFDGENVCIYGLTMLISGNFIDTYSVLHDDATFDNKTGTITINTYDFNNSAVYEWWAYVEEE